MRDGNEKIRNIKLGKDLKILWKQSITPGDLKNGRKHFPFYLGEDIMKCKLCALLVLL